MRLIFPNPNFKKVIKLMEKYQFEKGKKIDLACVFEFNHWKGKKTMHLIARGIRLSHSESYQL